MADKAKLTQALISDPLGSKHGRYEAVFLRRGRNISDKRMERLEELAKGICNPQDAQAVMDQVTALVVRGLAASAAK